MVNKCDWCGNYRSCCEIDAEGQTFAFCDDCIYKLSEAKKGFLDVRSIASKETNSKALEFFSKKYASPAKETTPSRENTAQEVSAQAAAPLRLNIDYSVYQIASDVRFLRNVVLAGIILLGISSLFSLISIIVDLL